jgi:hypothetical protein
VIVPGSDVVNLIVAGLGSSVGLYGDKLGIDDFSYQSTHFVSLDRATAVPGAAKHLLLVWGALLAITIVQGFVSAYFLKRIDVRYNESSTGSISLISQGMYHPLK